MSHYGEYYDMQWLFSPTEGPNVLEMEQSALKLTEAHELDEWERVCCGGNYVFAFKFKSCHKHTSTVYMTFSSKLQFKVLQPSASYFVILGCEVSHMPPVTVRAYMSFHAWWRGIIQGWKPIRLQDVSHCTYGCADRDASLLKLEGSASSHWPTTFTITFSIQSKRKSILPSPTAEKCGKCMRKNNNIKLY